MADRVLPSREKWNTPHSVETAWDIAAEMTTKERRQIAAAWLAGELITPAEAQLHAVADISKWESERGL